MKICVTSSTKYTHLLPVFDYLFKKYWGGEYELYVSPVPANEWSTDLRSYFENKPQNFIWLMEDTFIKGVDTKELSILSTYCDEKVGRIDLTTEMLKRDFYVPRFKTSVRDFVYAAAPNTNYRLSTQPSIWNRDYLLQYLTPGLTPWQFEVQQVSNDWVILASGIKAVFHNEGVRKHNPHELDLNGFCQEDIEHIKSLL